MKDIICGFLAMGDGTWFHRWHFYRWGARKRPHDKFRNVWRMLSIKTGESVEI